jgi:hypothetical protein
MRRQIDGSVLQMALVGYQAEHRRIEEKIAEIRERLGQRPASATAPASKRRISAAARKRIAAAQKKRWQEFHARQKQAARPKAVKTVPKAVSPDVKQKRLAALAKARAAKAAKKAGAAAAGA